jgi:hypothetical protein
VRATCDPDNKQDNKFRSQDKENFAVIGASLSRGSLPDVTQTTSLYMFFHIYRLYYPQPISIGQGGIDYGGLGL